MGRFIGAAGLAAALIIAAQAAPAQEALSLSGGFTPDPVVRAFSTQGLDQTAALVRGCPGYAPAAPVVIARLDGANAPLRIFARGAGLAAMVAVGPDGVYRCALADAQGVAHVRYERALSGDYAVWPATAFPGATATGDILLSEVDIELDQVPGMVEGGAAAEDVAFDVSADPAWGVLALPAGSGLSLPLQTAPRASLSGLDAACSGAADPVRPDLVIALTAPEAELHFFAQAALDATLAVVEPDGTVHCADDSIGSNPLVTLRDAPPGEYALWVGAWSDAEGEALLTVDRAAPAGAVEGGGTGGGALSLDTAAPAAWGVYAMPATGSLRVGLTLSGLQAASVADPACSGSIDPTRPDVVLTLAVDEPALRIAAASGVDTTLVVVGPDGVVQCNDDRDGINPGLSFDGAAAGDYAIWVGVWAGAEGAAELLVDRVAPQDEGAAADNPFAGVTLTSAVQALDIMLAAGGAELLRYARLEETSATGFILHDVAITDPEGSGETVRLTRLTVSDLDLAGLSAGGAEQFAIRLDGLDYAALASAARAQNGPPLPLLDPAPPLSIAVSLLPPGGDAGRRAMTALVDLEGMLTLSASATLAWTPGMAAGGGPDPQAMIAERLDVELRDLGFVGAALDAVAAQEGRPRAALVADLRGMLGALVPPGPAGSPLEALRAALTAKLDALDRDGVMRLRFAPSRPTALGELAAALSADPSGAGLGEVAITYTPLP